MNDNGWIVEKCYFDKNGTQVATNENVFQTKMKWNSYEGGFQPEYYFYDEKNNLVNTKSGGYASYISKFDFEENHIETRYFDKFGKPVKRNKLYAIIRYMYNENGQGTERSYYDEKDKLVLMEWQ